MSTSKWILRIIRVGVGVGVLAAAALTVFLFTRGHAAKADARDKDDGETPLVDISVKTVRPRLDRNFQITVERPADVEAYYRAEIESRVAGEVKAIRVARGSRVEKDQALVQLFVPDLLADERAKANVVKQRERELQLTERKAEAARAAVKTAEANVEEKKTLLDTAVATTAFRKVEVKRVGDLVRRNSMEPVVLDEAEKNLAIARSAEAAATAARLKAVAEVEDARVNVKVMEAEVERVRQLIEVARSDEEEAQARVDFARVKAPFRGTVVDRKVDPGDFVQNASTGHPTPMLSLVRTDIVTVVMRVPDNYAPFVSPGTEAVIELDALPGVKIHGKVTRFGPSLETASRDRTMRVEVDLWNCSPDAYKPFFADPKNLADLKEGPLPLVPEFTGKDPLGRSTYLMPDMYGKMTLILKTFGDTYLIPSQAVLRQGGRTYIYVVEEGKAHRVPVDVQVDDGNLAKVERLGAQGEVLGDLTGKEEVIVSNQEELTEGQPVMTSPQEDWTNLKDTGAAP
jgi:multidrug resistance efflux pump